VRLAVATNNPGKLREIGLVLVGHELVERPSIPEPVEDGSTLLENARIKARAVCVATGLPAVADDTGLFVDFLDGGPGVETAHFGGWEKLLPVMAGASTRRAVFRTVALVVFPDGREVVAEGSAEGSIALEPRGSRGWGYDPVFVPDDGGDRTFAEMSADEKEALSHRGRAFHALAKALADLSAR
jgi:XTP/dITP diphosphohydrolase